MDEYVHINLVPKLNPTPVTVSEEIKGGVS